MKQIIMILVFLVSPGVLATEPSGLPAKTLRCYPVVRQEGPAINGHKMDCLDRHVFPHKGPVARAMDISYLTKECSLEDIPWYDQLPPTMWKLHMAFFLFHSFKITKNIPFTENVTGNFSMVTYCLKDNKYIPCNDDSPDMTSKENTSEYHFALRTQGKLHELHIRWLSRWPEYGPDWKKDFPGLFHHDLLDEIRNGEDRPRDYFGSVTSALTELVLYYSDDQLQDLPYVLIQYRFDSMKMVELTEYGLPHRFAFAAASFGKCAFED
jgi:hypothetical protein